MAEIVKDKSPCSPESPSAELRRLKRPDRRRFQSDLERLNNAIKTKESEFKCVQAKSNAESFQQDRLRILRQDKEDVIDRRRKIDERLLTVNKEITNKRDGLSRVHSTLKYKSEEWINEAIKRLEYQLRVHNFKLKEEKTIVKEIDSLNRSRRNLREYLARKSELDTMAKEQDGMRHERDALFKKVTSLKADEEKAKKEHAEVRSHCEKLKQELDHMYQQKRNLVSEFRKISVEYNQQRVEQRRLTRKKSDNDSKETEPYLEDSELDKLSEETRLCKTLLAYLQRFDCKTVSSFASSSGDTCDSISERATPVTPCKAEECFVLRKRDEEEWYCVGSKGTRGKRNVKRDKKRNLQQQKKKCITHTPEIFHQFERLCLKPPASITEVPSAVEQLKAKKKYLQHLISLPLPPETPSSPDKTAQFPLYAFAQATSPDRDTKDGRAATSKDLTDDAETVRNELTNQTESVNDQVTNGTVSQKLTNECVAVSEDESKDFRLKRANFRLVLQKCKPETTVCPVTNRTCDTLVNGFGDKNGNVTDGEPPEIVFQKDIMLLPGHLQQLHVL